MKNREEILERLRAVREDLSLGQSYGGPDPSPTRTAEQQAEVRVLSWVLNKEFREPKS